MILAWASPFKGSGWSYVILYYIMYYNSMDSLVYLYTEWRDPTDCNYNSALRIANLYY